MGTVPPGVSHLNFGLFSSLVGSRGARRNRKEESQSSELWRMSYKETPTQLDPKYFPGTMPIGLIPKLRSTYLVIFRYQLVASKIKEPLVFLAFVPCLGCKVPTLRSHIRGSQWPTQHLDFVFCSLPPPSLSLLNFPLPSPPPSQMARMPVDSCC